MNGEIRQTKIIDGKLVSGHIKEELKARVGLLKEKGVIPGLVAVLVGDNPASQIYVKNKTIACQKLGAYSETIKKPANISQSELIEIIHSLNNRPDVDGILVQLPLPDHLDELAVTLEIDPRKDVDGFHPFNVGMMLIGHPVFLPATPYGIMELLRRYEINPSGREVVILGRSNIVGKPLGVMLAQKTENANATVTYCHSRTVNIKEHCLRADILIAAIGVAEFVKADMIKDGAVVIDVGQNVVEDKNSPNGTRLTGDVDFIGCSEKASFITPVPGGVGPMTIAMLLSNTIMAAEKRADLR